jgi:hypothetical protein
VVHQLLTFSIEVATTVGSFDFATYRVCQGHFGNFAREIRALGTPVAEAGAQTMRRHTGALHTPQQHQERHV